MKIRRAEEMIGDGEDGQVRLTWSDTLYQS